MCRYCIFVEVYSCNSLQASLEIRWFGVRVPSTLLKHDSLQNQVHGTTAIMTME